MNPTEVAYPALPGRWEGMTAYDQEERSTGRWLGPDKIRLLSQPNEPVEAHACT
jgi:hypothetical protein